MPSVGFEATSTSEFGDEITLASGTPRVLNTVKVTMSSWACQEGHWYSHDCYSALRSTYSVPITLNVYAPSTTDPSTGVVTPGPLRFSVTQTFSIPYRPTANISKCHGADLGKWYRTLDGTCYNGKAKNIVFKVGRLGVQVGDDIVIGIAYNTTHYGYRPIGEAADCFTSSGGCPYDSLNVGLGPSVVTGSKPYPDTVFQNSSSASSYCDATPTVGIFNLDSPTSACWSGYVPAIQVTTT